MSTGVIPLVNTQAKPQLLSLSTGRTSDKDSSHARVTWDMNDGIQAPEKNWAAKVSVNSMVFTNSFRTLNRTNNILKVYTTYKVNGTMTEQTSKIVIPEGNYNWETLQNQLNSSHAWTQATTSYAGLVLGDTVNEFNYGLGWYPTTAEPTIENAASASFDSAKYSISGPKPQTLGNVNAAHEYVGFYLLWDDDTAPCMELLGFGAVQGNGAFAHIVKITDVSGSDVQGVGFKYTNTGAGTPYTYNNLANTIPSIEASNIFTLDPIQALNIKLDGVRGEIKSGNQLPRNETIAVVPVNAPFGYRAVYQPPAPFKSVITDMNLTHMTIRIEDADTGNRVDFYGANYVLNIEIEWFETDNVEKSEKSLSGEHKQILPLFHHENPNHLLPHSSYDPRKKRKNHYRHDEAYA